MNEVLQSETLTLTKYDKQTKKRNSYQDEELPEFANTETMSLTKYSKNTEESKSNSIQTLCLTDLSKQTSSQASQFTSQRTLSLTIMTKITIQEEESRNVLKRSF